MLKTEMRNPASMHLDRMDTLSMLRLINRENARAVEAVEEALPAIARAVDAVTAAFRAGGRLFYIGAGTSGRLAVADAAECPPTFGVSPDMVVGILAGGERCMTRAGEGEEDNGEAGRRDLLQYQPGPRYVVVGISAAGGAAYVLGAVAAAREAGSVTVGLTCNADSRLAAETDIAICTDTGPEVVTGSTRMKAGTAHKLVLNMLSTCGMVQTGKVRENLMINLKPTNQKLRRRMIGIVTALTGMEAEAAEALLEQHGWSIPAAVDSLKDPEDR